MNEGLKRASLAMLEHVVENANEQKKGQHRKLCKHPSSMGEIFFFNRELLFNRKTKNAGQVRRESLNHIGTQITCRVH